MILREEVRHVRSPSINMPHGKGGPVRIRTIKPEFWRSDDIDALSIEDRLLFIGLWSYVDDAGVGVDKESSIAADLFAGDLARDFSETSRRVHGGLKRLETAGLITRYEASGKRFLHVTKWSRHQKINRATTSRRPLPTCANADAHGELSEDYVSPPEEQPLGTGEQGNRKKTSSSATAAPRADVDRKTETSEEKREDVEALCNRLAEWMIKNEATPKINQRWRQHARLLLDKDGRELAKALNLIDWCQQHHFWKSTILSIPKFREKYDQLAIQAREEWRRNGAKAKATSDARDPDKNPWAGVKYA